MSVYGTGADGALNFDGVSTVLGLAPTGTSPKVYTLTASINASSITIGANVDIFTANWKLFCTGACTGAGSTLSRIHCNGGDAPAASGIGVVHGVGVPSGFFDLSAPGGSGPQQNIINAVPSPITTTGHALAGTSGGGIVTPGQDGPSRMKGGGGGAIWNANQSFAGTVGGDHTPLVSSSGFTPTDQAAGFPADNITTRYRWGSGGGEGNAGGIGTGGGSTNPVQGGGGGGGACLFFAAQSVSGVRLQANGGRGGDALAGNVGTGSSASGGGGGGGGVLIFYYDTLVGDVVTEANGGGPGFFAVHGLGSIASNGGSGAPGWIYLYSGTAGVPDTAYWGPHFPDASGTGFYWGPHFPDGKPSAAVIPPATSGGAATFLLLESGSKITYSWGTDIRKMWSGREYRLQPLRDPKRTFVGAATLIGDVTRAMRARLARFAAVGSTFLLGLPFEAITIRADATGLVIPTTDTTGSDWMQLGQRIAITDGAGASMDATIQAFTSSSITIDVDPGALGAAGGQIMPTVPIYFDPQMTFVRSRGLQAVEQWQLNARAAVFGYPVQQGHAFAPLTGSAGTLHDVVVATVVAGPAGNAYTISFVGDSAGMAFDHLTNVGTAYTVHYTPGVTTVEYLQTLAAGTFTFGGGWVPGATLGNPISDDVGPVAFAGGVDGGYGTMGAGATVATYDLRPLWDRRIQVDETATDSIQSLAELVDLDGIPLSIGTANQADWGRSLYLRRTDRDEWQWLKAFMSAVWGGQVAFWLPSFRPDLVAVGFGDPDPDAGGLPLLTLVSGENAGDPFAWWPTQRDRLMIQQADGTRTYARIKTIVDNLDGTLTVQLDYASAPSGAAIALISWLELVRFEDGVFEVEWSDATFTFQKNARVVQQ